MSGGHHLRMAATRAAIVGVHTATSYVLTGSRIIFSAFLPFFVFGRNAVAFVRQKSVGHIGRGHRRRMMVIGRIVAGANTLQTILMVQILADRIEIGRMHRWCHVDVIRARCVRRRCVHGIQIRVGGRNGHAGIGNVFDDRCRRIHLDQ